MDRRKREKSKIRLHTPSKIKIIIIETLYNNGSGHYNQPIALKGFWGFKIILRTFNPNRTIPVHRTLNSIN